MSQDLDRRDRLITSRADTLLSLKQTDDALTNASPLMIEKIFETRRTLVNRLVDIDLVLIKDFKLTKSQIDLLTNTAMGIDINNKIDSV